MTDREIDKYNLWCCSCGRRLKDKNAYNQHSNGRKDTHILIASPEPESEEYTEADYQTWMRL